MRYVGINKMKKQQNLFHEVVGKLLVYELSKWTNALRIHIIGHWLKDTNISNQKSDSVSKYLPNLSSQRKKSKTEMKPIF